MSCLVDGLSRDVLEKPTVPLGIHRTVDPSRVYESHDGGKCFVFLAVHCEAWLRGPPETYKTT